MKVENWVSELDKISRAEESYLFETNSFFEEFHLEDTPHLPMIELKNQFDNIKQIFAYSRSNKLPLFLYKKNFTQINLNISIDEIEDDKWLELINEKKWYKVVEDRINKHNKSLDEIPINELERAILYTILPSQTVIFIQQYHPQFSDWNDLTSTTIECILDEIYEDYFDELQAIENSYIQKQEKIREIKINKAKEVIKQWESFVELHPDFVHCTNQKLRNRFIWDNVDSFIDSLSQEEKEMLPSNLIGEFETVTDLIWKRIKHRVYAPNK